MKVGDRVTVLDGPGPPFAGRSGVILRIFPPSCDTKVYKVKLDKPSVLTVQFLSHELKLEERPNEM